MAFLAFLLSLAQPASCQPAPMPISAPLTTQKSYHRPREAIWKGFDFIIILASATIPKHWSPIPTFSPLACSWSSWHQGIHPVRPSIPHSLSTLTSRLPGHLKTP